MSEYISGFEDDEILYDHKILSFRGEQHFEFHTHDVCELIYLKRGKISAIFADKVHKVQKNSLMIFRSNTPHAIRIDGKTEYERYDILFDETVLANQIFGNFPKELQVINLDGYDYINDMFKKLDFYYKSFKGDDLKLLVTNVIEEILFNIHLITKEDFDGNIIVAHPIISGAIEYINKHYTEPITIDDISTHMCITKSHLHHLFMEHLKISPKKYINLKRLSKAVLICSSSLVNPFLPIASTGLGFLPAPGLLPPRPSFFLTTSSAITNL